MNYRILLIDDDIIDIRVFARALEKSGISFELTDKSSAEEAEEVLKHKEFDCIFLDFQLPRTDGLSFLKKLRALHIETPTVIMTSQGDEMLAVEMMKSGAFDYMTKDELKPDKLKKILSSVSAFHNLILERRKTDRLLKRVRQNLEEAQELASLGSWEYEVNDLDTGFWSKQVYKILGIDPDSSIYPSLDQMLNCFEAESKKQLQEAIESVAKNHLTKELECRLNHGFEEEWVFMRIKSMPNEYGNPDRIVGTILDITVRKQTEVQLEKARRAAEAAALAKSEFLSNMSHEIRTPMNAIMGLTELLLKEELPEKVKENLDLIQYSADNLLVIINDILDYSKIEAGKISFEEIEFSLVQVIENLISTMHFKAESKGIGLVKSIDDALPTTLIGDPYRINQIVLNLVSNAIKFTSKGEVTVKAEVIKKEGNHAKIKVSVIDTGIGIPKDKISSIFESFTQAQSSTTRTYGGTGLGLPITKRLIEMRGGAINVESEHGKGSIFSFVLDFPIGKASKPDKKAVTTNQRENLKGVRIMVAEDNPVNQMLINQILSKWGVETTLVNDGKEALEALAVGTYDLIFMDLQMPEMNGYEATIKIRQWGDKTVSEIPVIALTADVMKETKDKVAECGFDDLVTKPFKSDQLLLTIQQYLNKNYSA